MLNIRFILIYKIIKLKKIEYKSYEIFVKYELFSCFSKDGIQSKGEGVPRGLILALFLNVLNA